MSSIQKFLRFSASLALFVALGGLPYGVEAAAMYDTREIDRIPQRTVWYTQEYEWPDRDGDTVLPPVSPQPETPVEPLPPQSSNRTDIPDRNTEILQKKRQNADVIGWLQVPGTNINEVVLQNPTDNNPYSKKNEYYLNRNFDKQPNKNGVFCVDHRATFGSRAREDLARTTTIYGHSWNDDPSGTLFSQLKNYRNPEFARNHPYIYFSTETENMAWEVFAVYDTTIYLPYVRPNLSQDVFYQTLDMIYALSYYNYDVAVDAEDRILALSTCTFSVDGHPTLPEINDYRFVVMARLVDPSEMLNDSATFAVNASRLAPDATRSMRHL